MGFAASYGAGSLSMLESTRSWDVLRVVPCCGCTHWPIVVVCVFWLSSGGLANIVPTRLPFLRYGMALIIIIAAIAVSPSHLPLPTWAGGWESEG